MNRQLYEIWQVEDSKFSDLPWRGQLENFVALFSTKEGAEGYMIAIRKVRDEVAGKATQEAKRKK